MFALTLPKRNENSGELFLANAEKKKRKWQRWQQELHVEMVENLSHQLFHIETKNAQLFSDETCLLMQASNTTFDILLKSARSLLLFISPNSFFIDLISLN